MASKRKNNSKNDISEEFQIQTEMTIRNFLRNDNVMSYEFPNNLSKTERAWIHNYVKGFGLISKSYGKNLDRRLTILKVNLNKINKEVTPMTLSKDSVQIIQLFLSKYPLHKDKINMSLLQARFKNSENVESDMGQLTFGIPQLPTFALNNDLIHFRMNLPIWPMKENLLKTIVSNQVVVVCGETGSGKTTQIPQFILDYSASCGEKCRIICTQPRRISAIAVAERVAFERGEKTGQTVGYHIRLESCVGPKTPLIYCTNGILLRTLMNGDACLRSFTHIIVDEIHERDRFSDFLLICLRECLVNYPHLRLILMSATMNVEVFEKYFNYPPIIHIPGRMYQITEFYLDDILKLIHYESPAMKTLKETPAKNIQSENNDKEPIHSIIQPEMEDCLAECFESGSEDSFTQLLQLMLSEQMPVNYQQSKTGYTGLMAAALHGNYEICVQLLSFGADVNLRSKDENFTAANWAFSKQNINVLELLRQYEKLSLTNDHEFDDNKAILELYHRTISDINVDYDLLHALLYYVHSNCNYGSILVFLAGYDDIVTVRDRIFADNKFNVVPYEVFTLHGYMQISDQHRVFNILRGKRKIILSTNIAETSITVDDVVFVIDSGKVKEKSYDAITGICSLQCNWISQACAVQRAGRAGRTQQGFCFHLFSRMRFSSMQMFTTPEMVRMPLHELCLQTKLLAPKEMKINEFLCRALEPPSVLAVKNAIKHLQEICALDEDENLSILGQHLVDLPVEPRLAKMLIYSVIFKCIDPVLTIVAFLSYRDPFVLPNNTHQKINALNMRKQFSLNTFSDHMTLLRAFQTWQDARLSSEERFFCNKYFITAATMEMVVKIRSQLLAQLRAAGFVNTRPPGDIRDLNENANNWALIKAILAAGCYPNIARINRNTMKIYNRKEKKILLHTSSALRNNNDYNECLKRIPTDWLIYEELSRSYNTHFIRSVTCISSITVALFIDTNENQTDTTQDDSDDEAETSSVSSQNWINFENSPELSVMVSALRTKLNYLITKKISSPHKQFTAHDSALVQTVANLLLKEDEIVNLVQPVGIGQRPKIMNCSTTIGEDHQTNRYKQRYYNKREGRNVPKLLLFDKVPVCYYNRYIPQTLPPPNLSEPTSSTDFNSGIQSQEFLQPVNMMDNILQLQINAMNVSQEQNDFSNNGVTVELDGAAALENYDTMYTQSFNPDCTIFFLIKTGSLKSLDVSISKKTWVFPPYIEKRLQKLFHSGRNILLVFTVQNAKAFHGIARLINISSLDEENYNIRSTIDWISRADISFQQVKNFQIDQLNDGEELNYELGVELWQLFTNCSPQVPQQLETPIVPAGRPITKTKQY